jgi:hypothetical protein
MKERPILFSGPMVRAILEGAKTQTRRVVKPQPPWWAEKVHEWAQDGAQWRGQVADAIWTMRCPYGQSGDQLWVREAWATIVQYDDLKPSEIPKGTARWPVTYYAAHPKSASWNSCHRGRIRPSIFMPRWASRVMLEVTGVRVERVQDISCADAEAEGCPMENYHDTRESIKDERGALIQSGRIGPPAWFSHLWDSINAKRGFGWDINPWVWVIEFEVLE